MTDSPSLPNENTYHHGNLKQALVDAYFDLLNDTPPCAISLRKLATHVRVAPTAVYNHFSHKEALLVAVRTRCLNHFAQYLDQTYVAQSAPEQNLLNLGKAYFRYSIDHTEYFKLIFQQTTPEEHVSDELLAAGMYAEEHLRKTVIDLLLHHGIPVTQYNEGLGAFACWAMAHGITGLAAVHINRAACVAKRWPKEFMLDDEQSVNMAFEAINAVLVHGVLAAAQR